MNPFRSLVGAVPDAEEPIRSELFGRERFEQHAESLARAQTVSDTPQRGRLLMPRVLENAERTRDMVLNSLGIVTLLKPSLGYKQCAELAREGYETGKSLHDIVVNEKKLLSQQKWDEIFSFENLINPKFEQ